MLKSTALKNINFNDAVNNDVKTYSTENFDNEDAAHALMANVVDIDFDGTPVL
jgi:hypothetical protein